MTQNLRLKELLAAAKGEEVVIKHFSETNTEIRSTKHYKEDAVKAAKILLAMRNKRAYVI